MAELVEVIRIETLNGWKAVGVDLIPTGANGVSYSYNEWGPDNLTFTVDVDPAIDFPPLAAFAGIEVVLGESVLWSGFIIDTPGAGDEATVSVTALGWQYHLDDALETFFFLHDRVGDWVDSRGLLTTDLSAHPADSIVEIGERIVGVWPDSAGTAVAGKHLGPITLDLGPTALAKRVSFTRGAAGDAQALLYLRLSNSPNPTATPVTDTTFDVNASPNNYSVGSASAGARYVHIFYYRTTAFDFVSDLRWTISDLRVYAETAYEYNGTSLLNARDMLVKALTKAPKLDQSTALIAATSLAVPHYAELAQERTPREVAQAANAFHGYRLFVDAYKRLNFKAATDPTTGSALAVDTSRPGVKWVDASRNNGRELYNRVIGRGRSGSGIPLRVQADYSGAGPLLAAGRTRTKTLDVGFPVDATALSGLTATYLSKHQRAPLKGGLEISADDVVTLGESSSHVPARMLGRFVGDTVLLENVLDPDTGKLGRAGVIVGVSIAGGVATVSIDSQRDSFEALLARMGVNAA